MKLAAVSFAALLSALGAAPAVAQAPTAPTLLVRAGNLFDSEAGRMVGPRDLVVAGDRIVGVGQGLTAPEGVTVLDLGRCAVTPGLIDAHSHLLLDQGLDEGLADVAARDQAILGDTYRVLAGARRARQYLEAGFTAVRDLGNSGRFIDVMLKRGIGDGHVPGPRMYVSGPGLAPEGGQIENVGGDPHHLVHGEYRIVRGVEDARVAVRQAIAAGVDLIKLYPEATPQRTRMSVEEMSAVVSEAQRHNLPVAAHATSDEAIREAVEAGVTSIEHAYGASDATFRLMAERGVFYVPTSTAMESALEFTSGTPNPPPPEAIEAHLEQERDRLRRARAVGVRIALGSDLYVPVRGGRGAGARRSLFAYGEAGVPAAQVLQHATRDAGALIGDDGLGVLKAGSWADLVAVSGDPVADLSVMREPRLVMKGGRVAAGSADACGG